jgi:hypothetical protein
MLYLRRSVAAIVYNESRSAFRAPRKPTLPVSREYCYFIGGDEGPVKIGYSALPAIRLKDLQCGSPVQLRILAAVRGGSEREREYHRRFRGSRAHGEWFHRTPDIIAEIDRIAAETSGVRHSDSGV